MWQSNFLQSRLCEKHHLKRKRVGKREHTRHNSFKYSRQGSCQQMILFVHFVYFHGHMISLFFSLQVLLILCMAVSGKDLVPGAHNTYMLQRDNFQWAKLSLFMFSNCILSLSMAVHPLPLQKVCAKTHSLWYELPVTTQRSLIPHWYFSQVCDNIQCPTRHCHDCLAFVAFQTCQRYNKAPVWEGSENRAFLSGVEPEGNICCFTKIEKICSHTAPMESGRF